MVIASLIVRLHLLFMVLINGSQRGMFIASLIVIFLATYPVESEIIFLSKNCIFLKLLSQLNQRANMIFWFATTIARVNPERS